MRKLQTNNFLLSAARYLPTQHLSPHRHDEARLILLVKGRFNESRGRVRYDCSPADVLFRRPGELHSNTFHSSALCLNASVGSGWMENNVSGAFSRIADM